MMSTNTPNSSDTNPLSSIDERRLNDEFRHLKTHLMPLSAPPALEDRLLKAFDRQHRPVGWMRNVGEWFAPGTAIAASVAFSVWMLLGTTPSVLVSPGYQANTNASNAAPFIALQSIEQISLEPNPRVIETQVPKMLLASLGVPVSPDVVGETVKAEMLVSAADQPLALRLSY
jgi:hypothetical protein